MIRSFFAFGGISCIYYELLKPNESITEDCYRLQLMRLNRALKEKRPYEQRHDKIILQHDKARPHVAKPTWKRLNEKFYPTRHITQTLPLPIITCRSMAWLSDIFILMPKNRLTIGYPQETYHFSDVEFKCCQKDGKH